MNLRTIGRVHLSYSRCGMFAASIYLNSQRNNKNETLKHKKPPAKNFYNLLTHNETFDIVKKDAFPKAISPYQKILFKGQR